MREEDKPLGGIRGFSKLETMQRYEGAKAPDWSMTPNFVRTHAECQYQFLKAVSEDLPTSPTLTEGLRTQEAMEASIISSDEGRWVTMGEVRKRAVEANKGAGTK